MNIFDNVQEWYKSACPDDVWGGDEMPAETTFNDVVLCLNNGDDVYRIIASDSMCR